MIYTFYSYKGGVGRSMALVNIAELMYRNGLKVLMVDWDLEAPGLERFYPDLSEEILNKPGVIDMLQAYKDKMLHYNPEDKTSIFPVYALEDYCLNIYSTQEETGGLWLLPAGCRINQNFLEYANRVKAFDWKDFYENWAGEIYLDWVRKEMESFADVVLIDSRTGVTEMGGVCTYQLADVIVMFCAANTQNIEGVLQMAKSFSDPRLPELRHGRELDTLIVPARIERVSETAALNQFRQDFWDNFARYMPKDLNFNLDSLIDLEIPYAPLYAFTEVIAVRQKDTPQRVVELEQAYNRLFYVLHTLARGKLDQIRLGTGGVSRHKLPSPEKIREAWLKQLKFRFDPFLYTEGEHDPHLIEYFYPVSSFTNIMRALSVPTTHLVFGEEGSGKSSLRNAVAQKCRIDGILPVVYSDFQVMVNQVGKGALVHIEEHVDEMLKAALITLEAELIVTSLPTESISTAERSKELYVSLLAAYVREYSRNVLVRQKLADTFGLNLDDTQLDLPHNRYERLSMFFQCIRELLGYKSVYFLVDPVNDIAEGTEIAWLALQSLLSNSFLHTLSQDKATLIFFLNSRFRDLALTIDWIKHGQVKYISTLEWSPQSLHALLAWRLKYCSGAFQPYESLNQLSNVENLDKIVIQKADNSPRNLVAICSTIFDVHSQGSVTAKNLLVTQAEVAEAFNRRELTEANPFLKMIEGGENSKVEFKATLRVNLRNQEAPGKVDKAIEQAVIQTLAGFMNTEGGTLFIGIDDEGCTVGLKHDLATLRKKNTDGFKLCFNDLVTTHLGVAVSQYIKGDFVEYMGEVIFVVQISSSLEPVFCGTDKVFYVRVGNSTRQLNPAEYIEYVDQHWAEVDNNRLISF